MKESSTTPRRNVKNKLMAATAMLLVATTILVATSYAWLVLSIAPEVTGIQTNIASNGALEIVLLNGETYQDPSKITNTVGGTNTWERNFHWSNMVDLNFEEAGLNEIILLPARLNLSDSNPNKIMDTTSILSVPSYDQYGLVVSVDRNTMPATYSYSEETKSGKFVYNVETPGYGVRAIGASNNLSVQEAAMMSAKGNLSSYTKSAKNNAISALSRNGNGLLTIITTHFTGSNTFNDNHLNTVESMVNGLQSSANLIGDSIRQGLIIVAAANISDETKFETARTAITTMPLISIDSAFEAAGISMPDAFETWITEYNEIDNALTGASNRINDLRPQGVYSWEEIKGILSYVINLDSGVYFNGDPFEKVDSNIIMNATEKKLSLSNGSGAFADIANFVGNYDATIETMMGNINVEVIRSVNEEDVYFTALNSTVKDMEAAGGDATTSEITLDNIYGYAIDLGFRTNANISDLLLQTDGIQRIYEDSIAESTMGNGSCMIFDTNKSNVDNTDLLHLADSVRVAFVTADGTILGIAKLNTSNYKFTDDTTIKIPLYLYDYTVAADGALKMGEREKDDNTLTALDRNVTKAISAIVWLDGDRVDNTMVSAENESSFTGILNLQFASSADLVPAGMEYLKNLSTTKSELEEKINEESEFTAIYEAGQGIYTSKSWREFSVAYNRAQSVTNDANATGTLINNADKDLTSAKEALEKVSKESLQKEIDAIRAKVGNTTDIARIVVENNGRYYAIDTYTEDQLTNNKGVICRVDYNKNLKDEGNGIMTKLYTEESWQALAAALYEAEKLILDPSATEQEIDDAITALDTLDKALEREVFFIPYVLDDVLYYKAVSGNPDTDNYGIWYYSNFDPILDEFTMIELAGKGKVMDKAATIDMETYFVYGSTASINDISVGLNKLFDDQQIIAIRWNMPELFNNSSNSDQLTRISELRSWATTYVANENNKLYKEDIKGLLDADTTGMTYEQAESWIITMERYKTLCSATDPKAQPADEDPMTFNQRVVLTKSIAAAKAVEQYSEKTALKAEVEAAEALLNNVEATVADAKSLIASLNTAITVAGGTAVTEATLTEYVLPVGSEQFEIAYGTLASNIHHTAVSVASGAHGNGEVTAIILTDKGVVITATKSASVYYRCEGAEISGTATVQVGKTAVLSPKLLPNLVNNLVEEKIESVSWISGNSGILAAESPEHVTSCTIKGIAAGEVKVTAYVTTVQGETYHAEITITVTE